MPSVSAHRLDEYLQAVLIGVEPDRILVDLALTPGAGVAGTILRLVDHDGDDRLTEAEILAYAGAVRRDLSLFLDGRPVDLGPASPEATFADPEFQRQGTGTSRLVWTVPIPRLQPGPHRIDWTNRHLAGLSVHLGNALQPTNAALAVLAQERTTNQASLTIRVEMKGAEVGGLTKASDRESRDKLGGFVRRNAMWALFGCVLLALLVFHRLTLGGWFRPGALKPGARKR